MGNETRYKQAKMNCWEFNQCGREDGGENADDLGVCPAYPKHGQVCARVAGTLCGGEVQGTFAQKLGTCLECKFYQSRHWHSGRGKGKTTCGDDGNAIPE